MINKITKVADLAKDTLYLDIGSGPDNFGKSSFTATWWQESGANGPSWRGQCFHAQLTYYVADAKRRGLKVIASRELIAQSVYEELAREAMEREVGRREQVKRGQT